MKANKKTVISTAAVLGITVLVAGGTIANFTDYESKDNNFTVGNIDIELYESQLHRMNSGRKGYFGALASDSDYCDWNANPADRELDSNTSLIKGSYDKAAYCTPGMNAGEGDRSTISAIGKSMTNTIRTWGYKDQTIKDDAATYKNVDNPATTDVDESGYFTRVAENIVPGQWVRKFSYVENKERNGSDAYVLIRYMVPTAYADKVTVNMPGTPFTEDADSATDGTQAYFTAVTKNATSGAYEKYTIDATHSIKDFTGYTETIDGTEYRVYAAVTTKALKPGEMTYWSPVNTIKLNSDIINTDNTSNKFVTPGQAIDVKVDAQAIQAKTFGDAIEAINHLQ